MDAQELQGFVLAQFAAESYLDGLDAIGYNLERALDAGNNNIRHPALVAVPSTQFAGHTRMTDAQIARFRETYDIVAHQPNTWTGFSATLFKNRTTGEYVFSFRSTEYGAENVGGDWARDGIAGADGEIGSYGFAVAQIADAEAWFRQLKSAGTLPSGAAYRVTGYSLGGHLATVFSEAHADDASFRGAVTFNSPGRGRISPSRNVASLVNDAYSLLAAQNALLRPASDGNIYLQTFYSGEDGTGGVRANILAPYSALGLTFTPNQSIATLAGGKITQVFGQADFDDGTLVTNSGIHSGNYQKVFIEDQPDIQGFILGSLDWLGQLVGTRNDFGTTHAITLLADSLAVSELMQAIDSSAGQSTVNGVLSASSNERGIGLLGTTGLAESDSLEQFVQSLAKLYGVDISSLTIEGELPRGSAGGDFGNLSNRDKFYNAVALVRAKADAGSGASLISFNDASQEDLASFAKQDSAVGLAYRYALVEGNPYAILKDYALYAANGHMDGKRLDLYSLGSGGQLTDEYLDDRAAFDVRKTYYNKQNARYDLFAFASNPGANGDVVAQAYDAENIVWDDKASGSLIRRQLLNGQTAYRRFGDVTADVLVGGDGVDRLYGGPGSDFLVGAKGSDYLEGGLGLDVYQYNGNTTFGIATNDGEDVIRDIDGRAVLRYTFQAGIFTGSNSTVIGGLGIKSAPGTWRSADAKFTYEQQGSDLCVSVSGDGGGTVTLKDFNFAQAQIATYDGIRLAESPSAAVVAPVRSFLGDKQNYDANPLTPEIDPVRDAFGNFVRADGQEGRADRPLDGRADEFSGSTRDEAERYATGAGNDFVNADGPNSATAAGGGRDFIQAGSGSDIVAAGGNADWVEGGSERDILAGNAGDDVLYGESSNGQALTLSQAITVGETALSTLALGDLVSGDSGDDLLFGADAGDLLLGGSGADVIVGGAGHDVIYGDDGLNSATPDWTVTRTVTASTYQATIASADVTRSPDQGGVDVVYAGAGDDWAFAGGGDDFVDGGAGSDVLFGEGANDILIGGEGDDVLIGDNPDIALKEGDDYLEGGAGNDVLQGNGGDDILVGGMGDDKLSGGAGKDVYIFTAGDGRDQVFDASTGAEASVLSFGPGFDRNALTIRPGSMLLDFGEAGSVDLGSFNHYDAHAAAPFESLVFADGTTLSFQDVLDRGFTVIGTDGDDNGHDSAHPLLFGTAFKDALFGLAGNDRLQGFEGNDTLDGGSGDDVLFGMDGDDVLLGRDGADALIAGAGRDLLIGGAGPDELWGEAGNDTLDGGDDGGMYEPDYLYGGAGDDTFFFHAGDSAWDFSGTTAVVFGAGLTVSDLEVRRTFANNSSIYSIGIKGVADDRNRMHFSLSNEADFAVFRFADEAVMDRQSFLRETWVDEHTVTGTAADDALDGYAGNDLIRGGEGNDTLSGRSGNDVLEGDAGHDTLDGGVGSDALYGGDGADTLIGRGGNDRLFGGAGDDTYVIGRADGDDVISEAGGAADLLRLSDVASTEVTISREASGDLLLRVGGGTSITVSGFYNAPKSSIERIEFADGMYVDSSYLNALTVPPITGTDADDLLVGTPYADVLQGGGGDDTLDGAGGDDALEGGPGTDTYLLRANGGVDRVIEDGAQASTIQLAAGWTLADLQTGRQADDLVLSLADGNSSVTLRGYYAGQANWLVRSGAGEQKTLPELLDYLAGIKPPSTAAEAEARFLQDAARKYATYLSRWGASGGTMVNEQPPSDAAAISVHVPTGETGSGYVSYLNFAHVMAGPSANVLDFRGTKNTIADAGAGDDLIDNDGGAFTYTASSQNDLSIGSFLYGGAGNDTIFGSWSNDWLLGGEGADYLAGSQGNDTYVVLAGDTGTKIVDEVNDYVSISGHGDNQPARYSADTLQFADIPYSSVSLSVGEFDTTATSRAGLGRRFSTLDISWAPGATVRLLLPDADNPYLTQFLGESYGVETIKFADGVTLHQSSFLPWIAPPTTGTAGSDATIDGTQANDAFFVPYEDSLFQRTTLHGFEGDDYLGGGAQNDVLDGGDGDDHLYAEYGDDVLLGGAGNDTLDGQWGDDLLEGGPGDDELSGAFGNDVYLFSRHFGRDAISDGRGEFNYFIDTVRFGPGISPGDIAITRDSRNLYLQVLGATDRVKLRDEAPDWVVTNAGVDRVEFADGTVWSRQDLFDRITSLPATDLDDPVWGFEAGETLRGFAGDDIVLGNGGADRLYGDAGNDVVYGGAGTDIVHGNDGSDDVEGGDGDDVLYGDSDDDYLEGDAGYDILVGGDGADDLQEFDAESNVMHAGAGDDYVYVRGAPSLIVGGTGDDWIDVYGGDSVLAFNRGDGCDTVYTAAGFTLSLGGGITASELTLEVDGSEAILRIAGDDSVRLSRQYEADPTAWPQLRLQIIGLEVSVYDLGGVIGYFNQGSQNEAGQVLSLGDVLPSFRLASSVDHAFGGDLAYGYARRALDEDATSESARAVIGDPLFGAQAQQVSHPDGPPISGGNDGSVVLGTNTDEQIAGGAGNDWLDGAAGNDVLVGGAGDDLLTGGPGDDTYVYNLGDGIDTIADAGGDTNTLRFGSGITPEQITLGLGSLVLRIGDTGGALHLISFDPEHPLGARDIDRFQFADGSVLSYEALLDRGFDLYGTGGADTIAGTATVDRIRGGRGNDALAGGLGGDMYFYEPGDGADIIVESIDPPAVDVLQFGEGIDPQSVLVARSGDDLILGFATPGDNVTLTGWFGALGPSVERVAFGDGTAWDANALQSRVQTNRPPNPANPIGNQSAQEDTAFVVSIPADTFVDPDGDGLSYSASLASGAELPAWLHFDDASRTFSGTPLQADVGTLELRLTATDAHGSVADQLFALTVVNVNDAPIAVTSIGDRTAIEDTGFSFILPIDAFFDEDAADPLAYTAVLASGAALPGWLSFDESSRQLYGTPGNADVGAIDLRIAATDAGGLSASQVVHLSVLNVNDAPVAYDDVIITNEDMPLLIPGATLLGNDWDEDVGDTLRIASASERSAAGSLLTLLTGDEAHGVPQRLVYDPGANFQHLADGASAYDAFSYSVADATGVENNAEVRLTVLGVNDAPVAGDDFATLREDVVIAAEGNVLANDTDLDDDAVLTVVAPGALPGHYGALELAANGEYFYRLDNTSADVQSLGAGQTVIDVFDYAVADGMEASNGKLAVSVVGTNDAPVLAHELANLSLTGGQAFTYRLPLGTFSDVDTADTLTFSARLADGSALPAWLSFDPATQKFAGTAELGSLQVKVDAADEAGTHASGDFNIRVGLVLIGGARNEQLSGGGTDDYVYGGAGNDRLSGGGGNDVLQGGSGNDGLTNESGNGLFDGGAGNDSLTGAGGNELFAGGQGNDVVRLGGGYNIVSFNVGDGKDTVYSGGGQDVLSLGGAGFDYAKLRLEKESNDLVLKISDSDQVTFKDWYAGAEKQTLLDLQIIADAMARFDPSSSDPLRNQAVEHFDFRGLVHAFDVARETTGVSAWALSDALTRFQLAGSDTAAYGADLAYWYGRNGSFAGMSLAAAQQIIGAAGFGAEAQQLQTFSGLQEGFVKLA